MDTMKIQAILGIAMSLIKTGVDIYNDYKDKDDLTVEDINAAIDKVNDEQEKVRQKLIDLIEETAE